MMLTTFAWASSTVRVRTGPSSSISSLRFSAARSERFRTTLSRTSGRTPLSAVARSLASTSRSTICSDRSSMLTMSSKTNICERTCSASSGSVLSSHSRIERSIGRGGAVDDLHECLDAADRGHVLVGEQRAHPPLQLLLDQPDHLRGGAVHRGDPVRDLGLLLGREAGEHLGRLAGGE